MTNELSADLDDGHLAAILTLLERREPDRTMRSFVTVGESIDMAREIQRRRATDLSGEERALIQRMRDFAYSGDVPDVPASRALLDRLLTGAPR